VKKRKDPWKKLEPQKIKAVAYVDPPAICEDFITTMPHSWNSNAIDALRGMRLPRSEGVVEAAVWTPECGPAVVIQTTMQQLFRWDAYHVRVEGVMGGLCSMTEYDDVTTSSRKPTICGNALVTELEWVDTGCNPANDIYIPGSKNLSRVLSGVKESNLVDIWNSARTIKRDMRAFKARKKWTFAKAKRLFPDVDFSCNEKVNSLMLESYVYDPNIPKVKGGVWTPKLLASELEASPVLRHLVQRSEMSYRRVWESILATSGPTRRAFSS